MKPSRPACPKSSTSRRISRSRGSRSTLLYVPRPPRASILEVKGEWREADALQVVSKIIKHGRDAHFGTGTLLGLDFDGTMEVSNSFPLPGFSEEENRGAKSVAQRESSYLAFVVSYSKDNY